MDLTIDCMYDYHKTAFDSLEWKKTECDMSIFNRVKNAG